MQRWLDRLYDGLNAIPSNASDVAVTSSYTPLGSQMFIYADATASTISVNLPSNTTDEGSQYWIKKTDATVNPVVLVGTVDGAANPSIITEDYVMAVRRFGGSYYRVSN